MYVIYILYMCNTYYGKTKNWTKSVKFDNLEN